MFFGRLLGISVFEGFWIFGHGSLWWMIVFDFCFFILASVNMRSLWVCKVLCWLVDYMVTSDPLQITCSHHHHHLWNTNSLAEKANVFQLSIIIVMNFICIIVRQKHHHYHSHLHRLCRFILIITPISVLSSSSLRRCLHNFVRYHNGHDSAPRCINLDNFSRLQTFYLDVNWLDFSMR